MRGEPAPLSADTAVASISPPVDDAELQQPPDAEPPPASSRAAAGDVATTASVVAGEIDTDVATSSVSPLRPVSPAAPDGMPSAPPTMAPEPVPDIVRSLAAADVPSRPTPPIESLTPPSDTSQSSGRAPEFEAEQPTQPEQPAPRPATPSPVVPGSRGRTDIILTSPRDGLQLTPDDPPVVVVEGEVGDTSISKVELVANQLRVAVPVHAGRFRRVVPILESLVRLRVEASVDGATRQSSTVTVRSTAGAQFGVIVFDWPTTGDRLEVEPSAIWRANPERLDGPTHTAVMKSIPGVDGRPGDAFYVRMLKPGVYTFVLRSRSIVATEGIRPTLYVPAAGAVTRRELASVSLNGAGRRVIARFLLPQGVFWDQDDWFSGRSESVDTEMKFRFPEGISWVERKAGLR